MVKKDCFAYRGKNCDALKKLDCEKCSFYATTEEANEKIKKANARRIEQGYIPRRFYSE